ncbi:MAG TPA: thioredoxin family protein [Oculatellaceae cyanobacterium]|jgi:thiol:disulfide interchange protein
MTPRFLAQEKKIRLLVLFLFVLLLFLAFRLLQPGILKSASKVVVPASVQVAPGGAKRLGAQFPQLNDAHFMGLRRATAQEIREALPEAQGKPALIAFSSRMCHDCQRLKPVVEKALSQFPTIHFRGVDVMEDQEKAAALLRTFKPVTVPVLVFIGTDGEIKNVLYNYQSPDTVHAALNQLQSAGVETAAKTDQ